MLFIYCPIPPAASPSSDLLKGLLEQSAPLLSAKETKIVVDGSAFQGDCPTVYMNFPVIDFRLWSPPIDAHAAHLIFAATHPLHRFCYRALKMPKLGPTIAIVGDLDEAEYVFTEKEFDSFHPSSLERIARVAFRAQILGLSLADEVWGTEQVTLDLMDSVPTHLIQDIGQSMEKLLKRIDHYIKNDEPDFRLAHHKNG